jgi:hypothetical protein
MSHDPVTESMLPKTGKEIHDALHGKANQPPKIDVFNLDQYSDDILRQIQLDLRIKRSRIKHEIERFEKIILRFQKEYNDQVKRSRFYAEIIGYIEAYFHEDEPCKKHSPDTPPSQN